MGGKEGGNVLGPSSWPGSFPPTPHCHPSGAWVCLGRIGLDPRTCAAHIMACVPSIYPFPHTSVLLPFIPAHLFPLVVPGMVPTRRIDPPEPRPYEEPPTPPPSLRGGSKSPVQGLVISREAMAGEKAPRPRSWRSFFMGMAVGLALALAWQRRKKVVDGSHGPRKRSRRRSKRSNRAPTIEVTLQEGQTLGDVVVKYVGDFTQENLDAVLKLNKVSEQDEVESTRRRRWNGRRTNRPSTDELLSNRQRRKASFEEDRRMAIHSRRSHRKEKRRRCSYTVATTECKHTSSRVNGRCPCEEPMPDPFLHARLPTK